MTSMKQAYIMKGHFARFSFCRSDITLSLYKVATLQIIFAIAIFHEVFELFYLPTSYLSWIRVLLLYFSVNSGSALFLYSTDVPVSSESLQSSLPLQIPFQFQFIYAFDLNVICCYSLLTFNATDSKTPWSFLCVAKQCNLSWDWLASYEHISPQRWWCRGHGSLIYSE